MLLSDVDLKPYTGTSYHNEELKSLTRYRFDKVRERAKLKTAVSRLVCILFPELEKLFPNLHIASVYALLMGISGGKAGGWCKPDPLENLLHEVSRGRYGRENAVEIRNIARNSIGSFMPAKSLELKHTISLIHVLDEEIARWRQKLIASWMRFIPHYLYSRYRQSDGCHDSGRGGRFLLLRFPGQDPGLCRSVSIHPPVRSNEKLLRSHGKAWLQIFTLCHFQCHRFVCNWNPIFAAYLAKKRSEGKHYNVAISHAAKKLVRLIYAMEKSGQAYRPAV